MVARNGTKMERLFTSSIEAAEASPPASARADRARTVQAAVAPHAKRQRLRSPATSSAAGRTVGVFMRAGLHRSRLRPGGHGCSPSAVICDGRRRRHHGAPVRPATLFLRPSTVSRRHHRRPDRIPHNESLVEKRAAACKPPGGRIHRACLPRRARAGNVHLVSGAASGTRRLRCRCASRCRCSMRWRSTAPCTVEPDTSLAYISSPGQGVAAPLG